MGGHTTQRLLGHSDILVLWPSRTGKTSFVLAETGRPAVILLGTRCWLLAAGCSAEGPRGGCRWLQQALAVVLGTDSCGYGGGGSERPMDSLDGTQFSVRADSTDWGERDTGVPAGRTSRITCPRPRSASWRSGRKIKDSSEPRVFVTTLKQLRGQAS